ncbi:MAG TPA: DoxX family protein [Opitutaceae bacterium]|jgi:putative oxidoreductase
MNALSKLHELLKKIGQCLQSPVLLVIRLYWGYQFILTGHGKLAHLDRAASYFASLHIPAPKVNVMAASTAELVCGALLILGLFSRFASLALICVMTVALCTAFHSELVNVFSDPDKLLAADPFLFLYAAVVVFAFGPGLLSVDALVGKETRSWSVK